eukprot:CAMPEP_0197624762 /NCGR_PEP_ID=MMETSP1338-20131121/4298_1 /TAXON_ID=43686 ORGANISM="Pelagodinium beii, Strain RCC1491" /NCGR_SAMPLE_ID=MMETSP1338 /ASSEMBLY_ACC=CAM_ASM_000754 /LENGTH=309 /DNA_ID=CAMNT_0043194969 /DNA_START=33 /DNA_END=962 /DNA_ORIENTATION=-
MAMASPLSRSRRRQSRDSSTKQWQPKMPEEAEKQFLLVFGESKFFPRGRRSPELTAQLTGRIDAWNAMMPLYSLDRGNRGTNLTRLRARLQQKYANQEPKELFPEPDGAEHGGNDNAGTSSLAVGQDGVSSRADGYAGISSVADGKAGASFMADGEEELPGLRNARDCHRDVQRVGTSSTAPRRSSSQCGYLYYFEKLEPSRDDLKRIAHTFRKKLQDNKYEKVSVAAAKGGSMFLACLFVSAAACAFRNGADAQQLAEQAAESPAVAHAIYLPAQDDVLPNSVLEVFDMAIDDEDDVFEIRDDDDDEW